MTALYSSWCSFKYTINSGQYGPIRKNFKELNKYFIGYKEHHPSDLKLVVIGKVDNGMEMIEHKDILEQL